MVNEPKTMWMRKKIPIAQRLPISGTWISGRDCSR